MDDELITGDGLHAIAGSLTGERSIRDLSDDQLDRLITIGQFLTDLSLAEIERRGRVEWRDGLVVLPYRSDCHVECILTRVEGLGPH